MSGLRRIAGGQDHPRATVAGIPHRGGAGFEIRGHDPGAVMAEGRVVNLVSRQLGVVGVFKKQAVGNLPIAFTWVPLLECAGHRAQGNAAQGRLFLEQAVADDPVQHVS